MERSKKNSIDEDQNWFGRVSSISSQVVPKRRSFQSFFMFPVRLLITTDE